MRNTAALIVIGVVALAMLLFGTMGMMGLGPVGMMGGNGMPGYGFNPFGMSLSLVFGALIIGGSVLLIGWFAKGAAHAPSTVPAGGSPLAILKLRYAKGEITKEQFEDSQRILGA